MKKIIITCMLASFSILLQAKNRHEDLAVKNIPESVKNDAHVIFRYDSTEIEVKNTDDVRFSRRYAITILDEKGLAFSRMVESYNKSSAIENMDATLLDANGLEIKSLKNRDVLDISAYQFSYVFNDDQRLKFFDFQYKAYPYTIIFEVEKSYKSAFFIPTWKVPVSTANAVTAATLTITFPDEVPVRYKEYEMSPGVSKTVTKDATGNNKVTWSIGDMPAFKKQPNSLIGNFDAPTVVLSPSKFKLFDNEGDMSSWESMGAFFYKLNEGRDDLSDDKKALVKSMIANDTSTYAKIQKLYAYMQQSTRYVADEYGISGWQTFTAKEVSRTGYGDCKGLVNYLKALLKVADIKAYTTLVYAGPDDYFKLDRDFPSANFNHVILCVPQPHDSIWIECTSQRLPAGYLGSFTQNRDVLITTEKGGVLCHTPIYDQNENFAIRKATMKFDPDNKSNQVVHLHNTYWGPMQESIDAFVKTKSDKEIKDIVNRRFNFPSYTVEKYNYQSNVNDNHLPSISENVDANVSGIINGTQKRTFINMAWMVNPMDDIFQVSLRTLPIVLNESFAVTDSVIVEMPKNIEIEFMPSDKNVQLPFAEYNIHFEFKDDNMILVRKFKQNKGVYDAKLYNDYQKLYKDIESEKDKLNVVVLNKAM